MKILLDTCLISEFTKIKPDLNVLGWLRQCDQNSLYLSSITVGELTKGIEKLPNGEKKEKLYRWLNDDLLIKFENRILSIDIKIMRSWGILCAELERGGQSIPLMDSLIGAVVKTNEMLLATNNEKDFIRMGIKWYNPWTGKFAQQGDPAEPVSG